jgi:hypothetical protein
VYDHEFSFASSNPCPLWRFEWRAKGDIPSDVLLVTLQKLLRGISRRRWFWLEERRKRMGVSKVTRQRKKEEYTKLVDLRIIKNIGNR